MSPHSLLVLVDIDAIRVVVVEENVAACFGPTEAISGGFAAASRHARDLLIIAEGSSQDLRVAHIVVT